MHAFLEEYQIKQVLGFGTNEIDGYSNFVFSTSEGNVYIPESVNRAIKRVYEDYNKKEKKDEVFANLNGKIMLK